MHSTTVDTFSTRKGVNRKTGMSRDKITLIPRMSLLLRTCETFRTYAMCHWTPNFVLRTRAKSTCMVEASRNHFQEFQWKKPDDTQEQPFAERHLVVSIHLIS